jgi:hypothetical protein
MKKSLKNHTIPITITSILIACLIVFGLNKMFPKDKDDTTEIAPFNPSQYTELNEDQMKDKRIRYSKYGEMVIIQAIQGELILYQEELIAKYENDIKTLIKQLEDNDIKPIGIFVLELKE